MAAAGFEGKGPQMEGLLFMIYPFVLVDIFKHVFKFNHSIDKETNPLAANEPSDDACLSCIPPHLPSQTVGHRPLQGSRVAQRGEIWNFTFT